MQERIKRDIVPGIHLIGDICPGLENVEEVKSMLSDRKLSPGFVREISVLVDDSRDFYMYVDDVEKMLVACLNHIRNSDERIVYLDFLHELIHMIQLHDGKNLYDRRYKYSERPTEIEAYRVAINEGRRIGMSEGELFDYLNVEWMKEGEHEKLARRIGLTSPGRNHS